MSRERITRYALQVLREIPSSLLELVPGTERSLPPPFLEFRVNDDLQSYRLSTAALA